MEIQKRQPQICKDLCRLCETLDGSTQVILKGLHRPANSSIGRTTEVRHIAEKPMELQNVLSKDSKNVQPLRWYTKRSLQ